MAESGIGLKVQIKGNALVISLPLDAMQTAVECFSDFEKHDPVTREFHKPKVTDSRKFAAEVVRALEREAEDGSTPVTRMLDLAFIHAVENGAEGIYCPMTTGTQKRRCADGQDANRAMANRLQALEFQR